MAENPLPSPEDLRQLLRYEPETGKLFWRGRPVEMFSSVRAFRTWNSRYANKEAFTINHGRYFQGSIHNRKHYAHRVIWAIERGEWPKGEIDHINGDGFDNRLCNLRSVCRGENMKNMARSERNTSGVTGVYWSKAGCYWQAAIGCNGKIVHLGAFANKQDAIRARKSAERLFGFHENHGR